mgnify:CR=1 FL=1
MWEPTKVRMGIHEGPELSQPRAPSLPSLIFGPLHDALMEDSLDKVEADLSGVEWKLRAWSPYVKVLRKALARKGKVGNNRRESGGEGGSRGMGGDGR